ncbi:plasmid pRiA4b ORF-3 family protein [Roseibium sediminicola]|uniref:Plasmid pRiA4b ORF-3 family protein n=1 Tax=Roseibium sediminicola TaxID=2933272 RepID=A0ABT0H3L6_9HYPH|nr:plasmid pRiA4b ORF-3 family protein [Roseibium sp. CAU 1639]MCK7616261.1 plasmid pRiA4b ORF-3 family protein [Roseibium sp. CAU 1639]
MNTKVPDAARLRITLPDLNPAPWRVIEVPLSMTFKGLHDAIQAAFLWFNCHLWEFDVAGRRYGLPLDDGLGFEKVYNANTARLAKLRDSGISEFLYTYDMGDNWEHHVEVLELFDMPTGARLPALIDGKWRAPPEDIGGAPGFEMFLEAVADPNQEEHENLVDWYGQPFDPNDIEPEIVKIQMDRLTNMRRPKK